jgi:hypothetical protein
LLIGDSVLLQDKKNNIVRPSDIGKPVKVSNSWTLLFNNGAKITTTGETKFETSYNGNPELMSLDNMSRFTYFAQPIHFVWSDTKKWDSKIELSDYTREKGEFDLNNLEFASFAGAFLKLQKTVMSKPNDYVISRNYEEKCLDIIEAFYPKEYLSIETKNIVLKKCWITELIDALFNFGELISIPDDILFNADIEWLTALGDGFFHVSTFDATKGGYCFDNKYRQFLLDYAVALSRANKNYVFQYKEVNGNFIYFIKFPAREQYLTILDGYENKNPEVLYDVGKGPYNAFGVTVQD